MAGPCEITLAAIDDARARHLANLAIAEVRRIEHKYSRYRADSVVSQINTWAGVAWTACDAETEALFGYADALYAASGGLFDISSGVLRRAWDFHAQRIPTDAALASLRKLIGWTRAERESGRIRLPMIGMEIDFGGFGKEYAADRAAALLLEQNAIHGLVNLAGDIRVLGSKPDGSPWRLGIRDPRNPTGTIADIEVSGGALATSGDYERFFEANGRRYCHILDPRSGMPVDYWRSVSVLAPLAIAAGSHATIVMLKQAAGKAYLDDTGLPYLAVDYDGHCHRRSVQPVARMSLS
ncbi:MAG: FAD:protein FMN transferase [Betaproteobacteria bacterium]|nr:FAD:protein FMN transferase [Betaproteobacteria bacterium]